MDNYVDRFFGGGLLGREKLGGGNVDRFGDRLYMNIVDYVGEILENLKRFFGTFSFDFAVSV